MIIEREFSFSNIDLAVATVDLMPVLLGVIFAESLIASHAMIKCRFSPLTPKQSCPSMGYYQLAP